MCGYFRYPRGSAGANYVQYLAGALRETGREIFVVSDVDTQWCPEDRRSEYQGVHVVPYRIPTGCIRHYIGFRYRKGVYIRRELKKFNLDSSDVLLVYSRDPVILQAVLREAKAVGTRCGVCVVEWFGSEEFPKGKLDPDYLRNQLSFTVLNERYDFILPISTCIEKYYREKGCQTFLIPCLADTEEYPFHTKVFARVSHPGSLDVTATNADVGADAVCVEERNSSEYACGRVRRYLFPANGKMKDSLRHMLEAFALLTEGELERVEFHLCGCEREAKALLEEPGMMRLRNGSVQIHQWMSYEHLIDLYREMDFLLLARDLRRMTLANFPSKVPEALTYGLIPICSRVGDYTEYYLQDGVNSLQMEGCSAEVIAEGIRRSLRLSGEQLAEMSAACRRTATERFDYRRWSESLDGFLNGIRNGN